ncbi:TadE/TadG family type IV pilus assembly protein [Vibrio sinaloensis]|uniref:TadE/TadG family type IV pilus assembly protein n=1 Tax=Photobacterium sp. (strain ATCC 43367) TaxID=379097 RepID=UPI0035E4ECD4
MLAFRRSGRRKAQQGLTLVVMTVSMAVIVGVAALSIDANHLMVSKNRLQNALDTAALAGATVANRTYEEDDAKEAIVEAYNKVTSAAGNDELVLAASDDGTSLKSLTIEYSDNANSGFSSNFPSSADYIYVRLQVSNVELNEYLAGLLGYSKSINSSTVAGPVFADRTSNILPIGMCEGDLAGDPAYPAGYEIGTTYEIKSGSQSDDPDGLGAGNYHLLDVGSGKSAVSDALVGKNTVVVTVDESIDSETGNAVGATDSIDSRFEGKTLDGVYYPPDLITTEPSPNITTDNLAEHNASTADDKWTYNKYLTNTKACLDDKDCLSGGGAAWRRVLPVPILDCDSAFKAGGKIEFNVNSIGCFFMTQRYSSSQSNGKLGQQSIFGEFINHCSVVEGGATDTDTGITRIVLFKDPNTVGGS